MVKQMIKMYAKHNLVKSVKKVGVHEHSLCNKKQPNFGAMLSLLPEKLALLGTNGFLTLSCLDDVIQIQTEPETDSCQRRMLLHLRSLRG